MFVPNSLISIYKFNEPIQNNTNIYFTIDSKNSKIGDQLVLMASRNTNDVIIHFPSNVYYTQCRRRQLSVTLTTNYNRLAQYFIYDGEYWVFSGDNC